jgi:hypothetical protein
MNGTATIVPDSALLGGIDALFHTIGELGETQATFIERLHAVIREQDTPAQVGPKPEPENKVCSRALERLDHCHAEVLRLQDALRRVMERLEA